MAILGHRLQRRVEKADSAARRPTEGDGHEEESAFSLTVVTEGLHERKTERWREENARINGTTQLSTEQSKQKPNHRRDNWIYPLI